MSVPQSHTLTKEERLCGKTTVSALISSGKWGTTPHLRFCWSAGHDTGLNRLMVSVPKKFFKRAVKRNLLKRRMREAYRLQKELLTATGIDLLLAYSHPEVADFATLYAEVTTILGRISSQSVAQ
jgi:ribonuclease P protein component